MSEKRRAKRALQRRLRKIDNMSPLEAARAMIALIGPERAAQLATEAASEPLPKPEKEA